MTDLTVDLAYEIVETADNPNAAVIWLHGLGADGFDFVPIVDELGLPDTLPIRFVFPHAPVRPVTINGGYAMRAWYDITSLDFEDRADVDTLAISQVHIEQLIEQQVAAGIPRSRIVLAGFSQGGALTLHTGLRLKENIAGLIVLSAYLPAAALVQQQRVASTTKMPIFMAHGTQDGVVRYEYGTLSAQLLRDLGYVVQWHDYAMAHSVCGEELTEIGAFLRTLLTSCA
jgi:phospholipase/carboxylesterase